jgi:glutathione S-transferase
MILYGGIRSPFVRRIEIWLRLQERNFDVNRMSPMGDTYAALKRINPVGRIPALSIDEGENLIETTAIVDYLEETAPADKRLIPASGADRRHCLQRIAIANSTSEKSVALLYERNRRPEEFHWLEWYARLEDQIAGGLQSLESIAPPDGWMGGARPDGSDVAAVCTHDFIAITNKSLLEGGYPKLAALAERANGLEAFRATYPE